MNDLTSVTTPTRVGPDLFHTDVPDGWQQGRGAFGGLVLANMVRAIDAFDPGEAPAGEAPRRLRSVTAEICAPVLPGRNAIRVERLRTGKGVSTVAARVERDGEVLAHMVGVLGRNRAEDTDFRELAPPAAMPPWREVPVVPVRPPFGPSFAQFMEYRTHAGPPYMGGTEAAVSGWVRPVDPGPARDAAYVTALADAWWPALFMRMSTPRPMATVTFTLQLFDGVEGLDPLAPLFYSARSVASRGGYMAEARELWGEDGRLVAINHQTFTIIK